MDHKPKHKKKPVFAGSTPRGPERWARAAANAVVKPNSAAARLYLARTTVAHWVSEESRAGVDVDPLQPFGFFQWSYADKLVKREYATCSVYCTVMQIQLDHVDEREGIDLEERLRRVRDAFSKKAWESSDLAVQQLNVATLKRAVRCQTCGSTISPK